MSSERLQKILARAGVASRRRIEEMIKAGEVTVNGRMAELGEKADLAVDAIKVDGRRIQASAQHLRYILLNKPLKCVSTVHDPEGRPTVMDMIPERLRRGIVPVGRLDFDSEGLLLLTNDGDLAQHVAHPRYGCLKTYEVRVKGRLNAAAVERLKHGMMLDGKRTAPIKVQRYGGPSGARDSTQNSWFRVGLNEGRTRQIREMFFRVGHPVQRLRRIAIGPVSDPNLPRGSWRELTEDEVEQLRQKTAKKVKKPVIPKAPPRRRAAESAQSEADEAPAPAPRKRPVSRKPPTGGGPPTRPSTGTSSAHPRRGRPSRKNTGDGTPAGERKRPSGGAAGRGRPSSGRPSSGRPSSGRPSSGRSGPGSGGGKSGGKRPGGRPGGRSGGSSPKGSSPKGPRGRRR